MRVGPGVWVGAKVTVSCGVTVTCGAEAHALTTVTITKEIKMRVFTVISQGSSGKPEVYAALRVFFPGFFPAL